MVQRSRLMIGVVGLAMVSLTACVQPAQPETVVVVPQGVTVAGGGTIAGDDVQLDSEHLAANPELMAVERYAGVVQNEAVSESAFYAANPELIVANRYSAPTTGDDAMSDSAYFAANPELVIANQYIPAETMSGSQYFANNPELMAIRN